MSFIFLSAACRFRTTVIGDGEAEPCGIANRTRFPSAVISPWFAVVKFEQRMRNFGLKRRANRLQDRRLLAKMLQGEWRGNRGEHQEDGRGDPCRPPRPGLYWSSGGST